MKTLIARLRKLAEPPTSLPTTEQAFRAAFQPFLRKLDGRLAQDNEDEVKELWERIHTLKNTPSATWAMAYSDAALDVYDAVLDLANALSLDDAKAESLAQKAQTDFAAWVSDHDKGPDATTVVAAADPLHDRTPQERALLQSLPAETLALFTRRSRNQRNRIHWLTTLLESDSSHTEETLALVTGMLKKEPITQKMGYSLRIPMLMTQTLQYRFAREEIGAMLRNNGHWTFRALLKAPGADADPRASSWKQDYIADPLFLSSKPIRTADDVVGFLRDLRPIIQQTRRELGEFLAAHSEEDL